MQLVPFLGQQTRATLKCGQEGRVSHKIRGMLAHRAHE